MNYKLKDTNKKRNHKDYSYSSDIKKERGRADWLYLHPTSFVNRSPANAEHYKLTQTFEL